MTNRHGFITQWPQPLRIDTTSCQLSLHLITIFNEDWQGEWRTSFLLERTLQSRNHSNVTVQTSPKVPHVLPASIRYLLAIHLSQHLLCSLRDRTNSSKLIDDTLTLADGSKELLLLLLIFSPGVESFVCLSHKALVGKVLHLLLDVLLWHLLLTQDDAAIAHTYALADARYIDVHLGIENLLNRERAMTEILNHHKSVLLRQSYGIIGLRTTIVVHGQYGISLRTSHQLLQVV